VDRQGFDADPDPTFDFDAYQDPDPPIPIFTDVGKPEILLIFLHNSASLHCFIFLFGIILVDVINTNILDSNIYIFLGNSTYSLNLQLVKRIQARIGEPSMPIRF
jgi:hypothetical protein